MTTQIPAMPLVLFGHRHRSGDRLRDSHIRCLTGGVQRIARHRFEWWPTAAGNATAQADATANS
ncbi:hypothetical protein I542_0602 [Mycobacteroides abscessus 1948]|uniref:Uncharacterized protein n=1 Tax=Mycobacteroides abscessus 1948 TaxID=1299323 RepID=A0A829QDU3_9MYCO|nr:hypothetical protein I542_0602 [Mycobacteroides abscessus 1948]